MSAPEAAAILGVSASAERREVTAAFRAQIAGNHPDLGGDSEATLRILTARDVLLEHHKRTTTPRPRSFVRRGRLRWHRNR